MSAQAFGFQINAGDGNASLKQNLMRLEDLIKGIHEEVEFHKKEVQILRVEKDELEKALASKA